jgi:hypothetical protein
MQAKRVGETYVLVDATVDPAPPVRGRVSRVGHVGSCDEAPGGVGLGPQFVAAAEEGPDVLRSARVAWVVLLFMYRCVFTNQCFFSLNANAVGHPYSFSLFVQLGR